MKRKTSPRKPKTMTEEGHSITVRLDAPSLEWLDRIRLAGGVSRGTVVRQALAYAGPRLLDLYNVALAEKTS